MTAKPETVVVLGASDKPERYSNRAVRLLIEKGHRPVPVNPRLEQVEGLKCFADIEEVGGPVDTVTVYLNPGQLAGLAGRIVAKRPRRVILNPGAESPEAEALLAGAGIKVVKACTLVMLRTGQFS